MDVKYRILLATKNTYFILGVQYCIESKFPELNVAIDILQPEQLYKMKRVTECEEYNLLIFDIAHPSIRDVHRFPRNILYSVNLNEKQLCDIILQTRSARVEFDETLPVLSSLSKKETEYFKLVTKGTSERTICRIMNISSKTISTHRRNIRIKMGLQNRNQFLQFLSLMTAGDDKRQNRVTVF